MEMSDTSFASPAAPATIDADIRMVASRVTLGGVSGAIGGFLVGGVGGRLAMFALRLTSDRSIRGLESDDGFTMGRFDLTSTLSLLFVTTFLGMIVGLIVVAGRPFFPKRFMPLAWAIPGALTGGAILIHQDGIDFNLLEPTWFAIALFVVIPALGAGLIAWLVEAFDPWWWKNRRRTIVACVALLPAIPAYPVAIIAVLGGASWFSAMQFPKLRALPRWQPARIAAIAVFAIITAIGAYDLSKDVNGLI